MAAPTLSPVLFDVVRHQLAEGWRIELFLTGPGLSVCATLPLDEAERLGRRLVAYARLQPGQPVEGAPT